MIQNAGKAMSVEGLRIHLLFAALLSLVTLGCGESAMRDATESSPGAGRYEKTQEGIVVTPAAGPAKKVRLEVYSEDIIRVTAAPGETIQTPESIMVVARPTGTAFTVSEEGDMVVLATTKTRAEVSLSSGVVQFYDSEGKLVLGEVDRGAFGPVTQDPVTPDADSYALRQAFHRGVNEALYGLGQHQNGQVNLAGKNVEMTTSNMVISIPFLVSSKKYGILWDNNSITNFGDPEAAAPIGTHVTLYDAEGKPGGLTARYYDGETLLLSRVETDLDYQFLRQGSHREQPLPEETNGARNLRIEWEGSIASDKTGSHDLEMYSSGYASLALDGEEVLNRWRMNWNPWYHQVEVALRAGEKRHLKVNWTPQGGYFRLLHHDPLPADEQPQISFASETGKAIDYYFVKGENADDVIAGYRQLTGKSVMLPRWAYGFWQSRERYKTQDELLEVLKEYRKRQIPIDNIVLDWSYWPVDAWGSHDFDEEYFPDPSAMVKEVHDLHAQIMISVWPKFYPTTDHYKELNEGGYMLNRNLEEGNLDWIGQGYLNAFYDAFAPEGRKIYWRQMRDKINVHGFDAWWLDAVEPDMHSNLSWRMRKELMSPNALGSGAEAFNAYAVPHAEGVYQGDREADPGQRVFILTRSGFGGIQRTGSAIWSGDTVSRWSNLKEQIAAGIGTGLAGMPNWTFDIGGFTPEDRFRSNSTDNRSVGAYTDMDKGLLEEWQALNVRWYQFGAFAPLYRAHGQNPYREIFNIAAEGSPAYDSMVWYTKLRYRLLPYIYAIAGDMYHKDATLMRGLMMDFPDDATAGNINDQYMFGPAFLVNPVYEMNARSRRVYLPANTSWYDFYTGKQYEGGAYIDAAAPLTRMPLFVRSGSIIPTAPDVQYADQIANADITLNVYTGADGAFELYEDDGRTYNYEKGEWSRIPFRYSDQTGTLTIGAREGRFTGMAENRTINVRWISGASPTATAFDEGIAETLVYSGEAISVIRK